MEASALRENWECPLGFRTRELSRCCLRLCCLHFKMLCHTDILTLLTQRQWPHRSVKGSFSRILAHFEQNAKHYLDKTCLCQLLKWGGTSLIEKNVEGIPPILCFLSCCPFILIGSQIGKPCWWSSIYSSYQSNVLVSSLLDGFMYLTTLKHQECILLPNKTLVKLSATVAFPRRNPGAPTGPILEILDHIVNCIWRALCEPCWDVLGGS